MSGNVSVFEKRASLEFQLGGGPPSLYCFLPLVFFCCMEFQHKSVNEVPIFLLSFSLCTVVGIVVRTTRISASLSPLD